MPSNKPLILSKMSSFPPQVQNYDHYTQNCRYRRKWKWWWWLPEFNGVVESAGRRWAALGSNLEGRGSGWLKGGKGRVVM